MHRMDKIKFTGTTWSFVKLMTLLLGLGLKKQTATRSYTRHVLLMVASWYE